MNRCCPNAVKESRSERVGLYRNEQGGFACLVDQHGGHSFIDSHSRTDSGAGPIEKEQCRQSIPNICNNMMHEHGMKM